MTSTTSANNCRVGKITMKEGGAAVHVLPSSEEKTRTVYYAWGEVTFRNYDGSEVTNADAVYYCESAIKEIMFGTD